MSLLFIWSALGEAATNACKEFEVNPSRVRQWAALRPGLLSHAAPSQLRRPVKAPPLLPCSHLSPPLRAFPLQQVCPDSSPSTQPYGSALQKGHFAPHQDAVVAGRSAGDRRSITRSP